MNEELMSLIQRLLMNDASPKVTVGSTPPYRTVPSEGDIDLIREEAYRIPSPPRVEMFDPAVGGLMATTRDDTPSLLLSLLR